MICLFLQLSDASLSFRGKRSESERGLPCLQRDLAPAEGPEDPEGTRADTSPAPPLLRLWLQIPSTLSPPLAGLT